MRSLESDASGARHWGATIRPSDQGHPTDEVETPREFFGKKIWGAGSVDAPPAVDLTNLRIDFGSGPYRQAH
jgi:hypothetical protein